MICDLQKASLLKRFSAFLLDFILIAILAVGFGWVVAKIANFDTHYNKLKSYVEEYEKNGISIYITEEELSTKSEEVQEFHKSNIQGVKATFSLVMSIIFLVVSLGAFFSFLCLEFVVPLFFKNGQTVGKKIFSVGVVQVNCVKVKPVSLFVRAMLGKYAIETMVPIFVVGCFAFVEASIILVLVFVGLIILQIVLFFSTKTFSFIHDVISSTVVVDMATQMIFDSVEDMYNYKTSIHEEEVKHKMY